MIQANKTSEKLLLSKEEAERYVLRVWHLTPDGYQVRDAPVRITRVHKSEFAREASNYSKVGLGYEVLHDPTYKPTKKASE